MNTRNKKARTWRDSLRLTALNQFKQSFPAGNHLRCLVGGVDHRAHWTLPILALCLGMTVHSGLNASAVPPACLSEHSINVFVADPQIDVVMPPGLEQPSSNAVNHCVPFSATGDVQVAAKPNPEPKQPTQQTDKSTVGIDPFGDGSEKLHWYEWLFMWMLIFFFGYAAGVLSSRLKL